MEIRENSLELYFHIPFCIKKCEYCDFLSGPATRTRQEDYIYALLREMKTISEKEKRSVDTIFIGGGTPSVPDCDVMEKFLKGMREDFNVSPDAEITIEANPGTLTPEKLQLYRKYGINRISIGLQSPKDKELKILGRIHNYSQFLESYHMAREAGFSNINIDLMFAIPGQTCKGWLENLRTVAELGPEHISAYSLIIEEGTPFYEDNKLEELLPSEEDEVLMYRMTEKILNEYGYDKYEISNYAKPGFESRHNLGYWSHIPYLGVGLNASSYLDEKRFENPSDMKDYLEIQSFGDAYEGACSLSVYEQMEEFMFLGLRKTKGISKKEFIERFGCSMDSVYGKPLIESMKQGMMKEEGDRVFLTQDGTLVSNQVLCEFLFDEEV